jgi:putative endonuclease
MDNSFYKGYSQNPYLRLQFHNNGASKYTSSKIPWKLVAVLAFENKKDALVKERKIKKYPTKSLIALINSNQNILHQYLAGLENR